MIDKDTLEMFERASEHMRRMEKDPEYRREIEKQLYRGAPQELLDKLEAEIAELERLENEKNSVS